MFLIGCQSKSKKTEQPPSQPDYIKYTATINQAESFILDSNYTDALKKYKEAFKMVDKPLAAHCFTAMQVSAKENDEIAFKEFSIAGMERGMLLNYYKEDSIINRYLRNRNLDAFVENSFEKANKAYKAGINTFLEDTLYTLSVWDNKWKVHYMDSLANIDPKNKKIYHQKYDSIVSFIIEDYLIPLIEEYGYPDERLLGIYANTYMGNSSYRRSYNHNTARVQLMHYYSFPRSCDGYNELFYREVLKGNMKPDEYAMLMDFQTRERADSICDGMPVFAQHGFSSDSTRYEEFNVNRAKIGLGTIQERLKKLKRGQKVCNEIREHDNYDHVKLFHWCG